MIDDCVKRYLKVSDVVLWIYIKVYKEAETKDICSGNYVFIEQTVMKGKKGLVLLMVKVWCFLQSTVPLEIEKLLIFYTPRTREDGIDDNCYR